MHLLTCPECGDSKMVSGPEQIYCSVHCARSAQYKARTGNPYKLWKKAVLERDKYTCQMCRNDDPEVKKIAHHIVNFVEVPALKLEPGNGMTLCVTCHDVIHGTVGNTSFAVMVASNAASYRIRKKKMR